MNLEEAKKRFNKLLMATGRENIDKLITWLETTDFYTAPASSNKNYHGYYKGGLLIHSLDVYDLFKDKYDSYKFSEISEDSIIIACLLHDVCKVGLYFETTPNSYIYNNAIAKEGHGLRSMVLINKYICLKEVEATLIKYHMGIWHTENTYNPEYKTTNLIEAAKKYQFIQLFWAADVESLYLDKLYRQHF